MEAKLGAPPKRPDNSSLAPAKGKKSEPAWSNRQNPAPAVLAWRALAEHPDAIVEAMLTATISTVKVVRARAAVGSDEISARVCGKNWWQ